MLTVNLKKEERWDSKKGGSPCDVFFACEVRQKKTERSDRLSSAFPIVELYAPKAAAVGVGLV